MKGSLKKVGSVLLNVLLWAIIIVAASVTIISLSTREKGVASVAGYVPLSIQTESMEDTIMTGDLIITKDYDGKTVLEKDTIISFFALEKNETGEDTKIIKTHRIIEVKNDGAMVSYVTKGDNNPTEDTTEVAPGDIVSVYHGTRFAKIGYALTFLKSRVGFFTCIIIPLFAFFIYQLYKFVIVIIEVKKKS